MIPVRQALKPAGISSTISENMCGSLWRLKISPRTIWLTFSASKAFPWRISVRSYRILFPYEDWLCQTADSWKWYEFYTDIWFSGIFFHPLFFQTVQKAVRHDTNRIRHIHQGIIWTSAISILNMTNTKSDIYNKCTCPLNGQEGGNMQICKVKIIRNSAERRPIWLRHR